MTLRFLCLSLTASVAVAAAVAPVHAADISTQSELVGDFNTQDTTPADNLEDLFNGLEDTGLDLALPSPTPDLLVPEASPLPSPEASPDIDINTDLELEEDIFNNPVQDFQPPSLYPADDIDYPELYSDYDTYYGAIGTTYLEYMRGFLPKLGFREHYVAARVSQYSYIFAFGSSLEYTGRLFTGSDIRVVTFNTYNNGSYNVSTESSFNLDTNNYMVYTDLSKDYPALTDTSGFTSRQILILITIMGLVWTIEHMYHVRKFRRVC